MTESHCLLPEELWGWAVQNLKDWYSLSCMNARENVFYCVIVPVYTKQDLKTKTKFWQVLHMVMASKWKRSIQLHSGSVHVCMFM